MLTCRLRLGGVVSPSRDRTLIQRLADLVTACIQSGPVLLVTDGLSTYV
jgi:hypothetical protein